MGYYTSYELDIYDGHRMVEQECPHCQGSGKIVKHILDMVKESKSPSENGAWLISSNLNEPTKWYEHESDMKEISKKFPNTVFVLRGEGEEAGDVWVKYFKNGKIQVSKAEIKLDDFDPTKLG